MPTKNFPLRIKYYDRKTTGLLTTGLLKTELVTTGHWQLNSGQLVSLTTGIFDNWSRVNLSIRPVVKKTSYQKRPDDHTTTCPKDQLSIRPVARGPIVFLSVLQRGWSFVFFFLVLLVLRGCNVPLPETRWPKSDVASTCFWQHYWETTLLSSARICNVFIGFRRWLLLWNFTFIRKILTAFKQSNDVEWNICIFIMDYILQQAKKFNIELLNGRICIRVWRKCTVLYSLHFWQDTAFHSSLW